MRTKYVLKRILYVIPVSLGVLIVVFLLLHLMPGGPASALLGPEATAEDVARVRAQLGLDQNIFVQLFVYMKQLLTFDFGNSIIYSASVSSMLKSAFPATLELAIVAMIIALLISLPLGILSAVKQNSWIDNISMFLAQLGISMPVFWMGLLMILLFSVHLDWLPSFGRGEPLLSAIGVWLSQGDFSVLANSLKKIIMPAAALGIMGSAMISRMIRSTMLDVLDMDYIRTARAKGTGRFKVIMKHAFRNALLPMVTLLGLTLPDIVSGSFIIETIFGWPGMGRLGVNSILQRDYPVVMAVTMISALMVVCGNLAADILYAVVDPRIKQG